jgi:glycolate oxidase iron-sulfur subunit
LLELADQCVKCGLCLPVCPSYRLYRNEADSPRGRISLIQGLLQQTISADEPQLEQHLDQCLNCGNCEPACPSSVKYGYLIASAKDRFAVHQTSRSRLKLLSSGRFMRLADRFGRLVPEFATSITTGFTKQLLQNKPVKTGRIRLAERNAVSGEQKGRVAIFTGCSGSMIDANAINSTGRLLGRLGYEVVIPAAQVCCGAMHYHEGYQQQADQLAKKNRLVFDALRADAILYFASGCGSHLSAQGQFDTPVQEATQFLASLLQDIGPIHSATNGQKIAIHSPCTLRNKTDAWPVTLRLIQQIAGSRAVELPENEFCCGGAGLHLIKHHDAAQQMLAPKLAALKEMQADVLLTSNTGCALHFGNAIHAAGLSTQVMHPAEWLSQQLT